MYMGDDPLMMGNRRKLAVWENAEMLTTLCGLPLACHCTVDLVQRVFVG